MAGVVGHHTAGGESTVRQITLSHRAPRYTHSNERARSDTALVPTLKSGPNETLRLSAVLCRAHASGVGKMRRAGQSVRFPTLKSGPSETLRLSAVLCRAHASGVGKKGRMDGNVLHNRLSVFSPPRARVPRAPRHDPARRRPRRVAAPPRRR